MRINIHRPSGQMSVDGVARPVDVELLPPGVEVLEWDSVRGLGRLQYAEGITERVRDRDLDAEQAENNRLRLANLPPLQEPIYREVEVQRQPTVFDDFGPYQELYDQWDTYVPPPPPPPTQEQLERIAEQEATLQENIGPIAVSDLKAMTRAELRDWYEVNITTNAQVRRVVRWLFLYIIRRL